MYGTDKKGDMGTGTWWEGVIPNLERRFENTESEFVKTRLHGYMSEMPCKTCCGTRLKKEALAVRLETATPGPVAADLDCLDEIRAAASVSKKKNNGQEEKSAPPFLPKLPGYSIHDVTGMTVLRARQFFEQLKLGAEGTLVAEPIAKEIKNRLTFLIDVGLGYLTLDRKTGSLSGGEAQRIRLATQVGSGLVGVCYVLDEPTIGLHQKDNDRLIRTLRRLTDIGNTVIIVEHDEDCIRSADYLIDIGPGAGSHGGRVVCEGPVPAVFENRQSTTIKYLIGECAIMAPDTRRALDVEKNFFEIKGCRENNLKNIDVRIPMGGLICVTGVSGSGKSTVVNQTLLPALK